MSRLPGLLLVALALLGTGCATTGDRPRTESAASREEAARINTDLGIGYFRQGRMELALERLTRAVEQDRRYGRAHAALAVLYQQLDETDDAERHFRIALRLSERDPELWNTYGVFLCGQQRFDEAEGFFRRAAQDRLYPRPELPLTNAGVCMGEKGDAAAAEAYFREALERNPRFSEALIKMAGLSLDGGNLMGARAFLQRYFAAAPVSAEALWLGVRVERALGDERTAREYAARLREDFADSVQARQLLESQRDER